MAALVADALIADGAELSIVPSSEYLVAILVVLIVVGAPVLLLLRDRWVHGAINLALAFCIYGFLVPNAVIALQNQM